jgi:thiamine kinase-like enzyme
LCRLHSLGWAHGDINRENFVILGSEAKLIDFEASGPATKQETGEIIQRVNR